MSILTALDEDLRAGFSGLDCGLVDAVVDGRSSMEAFVSRLAGLHKAASLAISQNALSAQTLALVRSVALASSAIVDNVLQIEPDTRDIDARRQSDIESVFERLSLKDDDDEAGGSHPPSPSPSAAKANRTLPRTGRNRARTANKTKSPSPAGEAESEETDPTCTHRPALHKWLLDNIRNPYPSKTAVASLAVQAGIPPKSVREWLSNMRRRVGWTSYLKTYFQGDKARAVDFAVRSMVVSSDETGAASSASRAEAKLRDIEALTESLYCTRYESSTLAQQIESMSKAENTIGPTLKSNMRTAKKRRRDSLDEEMVQEQPCRRMFSRRSMASRSTSTSSSSSTSLESTIELATPVQEFSMLDDWLSDALSHSTTAEDTSKKRRNTAYDPSALTSQASTDLVLSAEGLYTPMPIFPPFEHDDFGVVQLDVISSISAPSRKRTLEESECIESRTDCKRQRGVSDLFDASTPVVPPADIVPQFQPLTDCDSSLLGIDFSLLDGNSLNSQLVDENVEVHWGSLDFPVLLSSVPSAVLTEGQMSSLDAAAVDFANNSNNNNFDVQTNAFDLVDTFAAPQASEAIFQGNDIMQFLQQIEVTGQSAPSFEVMEPVPQTTSVVSDLDLESFAEQYIVASPESTTEFSSAVLDIDAKKERLRLLREETEKLEKDLGSSPHISPWTF